MNEKRKSRSFGSPFSTPHRCHHLLVLPTLKIENFHLKSRVFFFSSLQFCSLLQKVRCQKPISHQGVSSVESSASFCFGQILPAFFCSLCARYYYSVLWAAVEDILIAALETRLEKSLFSLWPKLIALIVFGILHPLITGSFAWNCTNEGCANPSPQAILFCTPIFPPNVRFPHDIAQTGTFGQISTSVPLNRVLLQIT